VLNLKRLFSLAIILILCLSTISIIALEPNAEREADSGVTRVEKTVNFLISQFNPQISLCREATEVAPNTYWVVSDNLLAWKALKMVNEAGLSNATEAGLIAEAIEAKLREKAAIHNLPTDLNGLPISFVHEAIIGDVIPLPNRTCNTLTLQSNNYTVKTEVCNGTIMLDWKEYADRLLYATLSSLWQGNETAANQFFEVAKNMWDGTGINDTATMTEGLYATYKLALFLYTSKVLGRKLLFEFELVKRIWSLQRETDGGIITNYFANGTAHGDANTETTSIVIIAMLTAQRTRLGTFAFYYPWYGTPNVSGYWRHWNGAGHNPDNFINDKRDIAAAHYPLLDVYDSNNKSLIKKHIDMAKNASIDGFIVSWWGINSFEDNATLHIKNVCEKNNFKFTIYYENTSSVDQTINDLVYILNDYANSIAWYKIDDRPVIYVYGRARNNLIPQAWKLYGEYINESKSVQEYWMLSEEVRKPPRYGIFPIHPDNETGIGYIESANPIFLQPNETYSLKASISNIRNDCDCSDVGFRINIRNETQEETLYDKIVNFTDDWLDLSFNVSNYAGQNVSIRVESYAGGEESWCSEWAAVDYFYIENSTGEIVSPAPFFNNSWKAVVDELRKKGFNPYLIMDFTGYEEKIQDFAEYFLNFTDGLHIYGPCGFSASLSKVFEVYNQASDAAHSKNKIFVATVMPGYDDTGCPGRSGYVVDRQNGTYYTSFWSIATACFPDGYIITSFNEWHESTEIEPSLEYGYQYINLTRSRPTVWTVDDDEPADFSMIQEAINTASPGDVVYVRNGTYYENVVVNKTLRLTAENREDTIIDARGVGDVLRIEADNVTVSNFTIRYGDNGIYLSGSHGNVIQNNNITKNRYSGITGYSSTGNIIEWNIISNNDYGIDLAHYSKENTIQENTVTNNGIGIYLRADQGNNSVQGNIVQNNQFAIYIHFSNGNNITDNVLTNSEYCIYITSSTENDICCNLIANNHWGIYFDGGNDNKIYHNNFTDNLIQAHISISFNTWDDGYPSGGNYWSDYVDRYPNATEMDGSGIWDTPYVIDENNQDNFPIIPEFPQPIILLLFAFTTLIATILLKKKARPKSPPQFSFK